MKRKAHFDPIVFLIFLIKKEYAEMEVPLHVRRKLEKYVQHIIHSK